MIELVGTTLETTEMELPVKAAVLLVDQVQAAEVGAICNVSVLIYLCLITKTKEAANARSSIPLPESGRTDITVLLKIYMMSMIMSTASQRQYSLASAAREPLHDEANSQGNRQTYFEGRRCELRNDCCDI